MPGFASREEAEAAGVRIGTPVTYLPRVLRARRRAHRGDRRRRPGRVRRAARARRRRGRGKPGPTLHLVWSVQEEHNLRGVLPAATALAPDIAIAVDLMLACDTPEMASRGDLALWAAGRRMSLFSFHGRGTLNGVIPHPALVRLVEDAADGRRACRSSGLGPRGRAHRPQLHPVHGRPRASPASTSASRCAIRTRRWRSWTRPTSRPGHPAGCGARPHHARPGARSARREPHARRRHRDVRVQGRPRGRRAAQVVASATRPHRMLVPQPGLGRASGRRGLVGRPRRHHPRAARGRRVSMPGSIDAVATSAIGPCMLPGGCRRRAADERASCTAWTPAPSAQIAALNAADRRGPRSSRTAATRSPRSRWARRSCGSRRRTRTSTPARPRVLTSTSYLVWRLTGEHVIDHYTAANFSPLYDVERLDWTAELAPDILPLDRLPRLAWSTDIAGTRDGGRRGRDRPRRGHAGHRWAPSTPPRRR